MPIDETPSCCGFKRAWIGPLMRFPCNTRVP